MKQRDLAALLSVRPYSISDWEVGKSEPNLQMLYKIATVFDVRVGYLLGVED